MVEPSARDYLDAISRELRVRPRYRRRVLAELAAHIEDAVADERSRGASSEEAVRRSLERLGRAEAVAAGLAVAHRDVIASTQRHAIRLTGYIGAAIVIACASLAPHLIGDADGHLGVELAAAVLTAIAVLALDCSTRVRRRPRAALAVVASVWIVGGALLLGSGDALFCLAVLGGALGAAGVIHGTRRVGQWLRGGA